MIGSRKGKRNFSRSIIAIAIFGIALGLTVMIVAVAIVTGFKNEISNKVTGFGAHIQILNLDSNLSYETMPVPAGLESVEQIGELDGVKNVQPFSIKAGIIKTGDEIHGAVLKGVDNRYDWEFIEKHLTDGEIFRVNDTVRINSVVLSQNTANLLKLGVGDKFTMYFIQDPPRARTFSIQGIYNTSLEEFDRLYIYADIKQVQRLNNWHEGEVSGYEVLLEEMDDLQRISEEVRNQVAFEFLDDGSRLKVETIQQKYTQIFDWLNLQDMNVVILISTDAYRGRFQYDLGIADPDPGTHQYDWHPESTGNDQCFGTEDLSLPVGIPDLCGSAVGKSDRPGNLPGTEIPEPGFTGSKLLLPGYGTHQPELLAYIAAQPWYHGHYLPLPSAPIHDHSKDLTR